MNKNAQRELCPRCGATHALNKFGRFVSHHDPQSQAVNCAMSGVSAFGRDPVYRGTNGARRERKEVDSYEVD